MGIGLVLVALAAVAWGTTGTTLKLMGDDSAALPLLVGALRAAVAAPLLLAAARGVEGWPRPRSYGFLAAGLCMAAFQVCYFSAVPRAGVAATALLAICSAPILVALLARVLLGERLTSGRLLALGLGVGGAGLLVIGAGAGLGADFVVGALFALGAGLVYSLYVVVTKASLAGMRPLGLAALTFSVAAGALAPVLVLRSTEAAATLARSWPILLYLGAVPTALAYWLYTSGLRRTTAGSATVVGLLEPLTATLLGVALFSEHLGPAGAVGALFLLAAVALLALLPGAGAPGSREQVDAPFRNLGHGRM